MATTSLLRQPLRPFTVSAYASSHDCRPPLRDRAVVQVEVNEVSASAAEVFARRQLRFSDFGPVIRAREGRMSAA